MGGAACGGQGGWSDIGFGGDNGFEGECRGGGGGGGEAYRPVVGFSGAGNGGDGAYGAGGGGGAYDNGDGGDGGFGGAGGGSPIFPLPDDEFTGGSGGDGGFGAGGGSGPGGAFFGGPGEGGTFAGDPDKDHGGGGAGLGGAIFGHESDITVVNSTFTGNDAFRGNSGGGDAQPGQDGGGAIFTVAGSLKVVHSTVAGNDHGGIGVYRPTTGEATAFELRNTIVAGNGVGRTCFYRNAVSATGSGNLIVDGDAAGFSPCPGIEQTDDPQLQPLQISAPGWTPTLAIPLTSPAVDNADPAFAEPIDQRTSLRPYGVGYDIGAYEAGNRPPATGITLDPESPNGSNGWYTTPSVEVTVNASDPDGTVAETRCALDPATAPAAFADLPARCAVSSVTGQGAHDVWAGSVDNLGTAGSPLAHAAVKIDSVPPTLSPALSDPQPTLGQAGVTATAGASDLAPGSGIASASCGTINTSTPGDHTVTCTATDRAGHTRNATIHYLVAYRMLGYFSPAPSSKWRVGTTVPVKIALAGAGGTRITDAAAAPLATGCRVGFSVTGAQTLAQQCMKYDPATDQFIFNWKLASSGTGAATIKVTITYPGTTSTSEKTEPVTITS